MQAVSDIDLDRELVRKGGLLQFTRLAWEHVPGETGQPFVENWHHGLVAEHLEAQTYGQIQNLIINLPPGLTKSMMVCVLWPAWVWTFRPKDRWIFGSYDVRLSGRDAGKSYDLMRSDWYQARWGFPGGKPLFDGRSVAVHDYKNEHGGFRFSTSCPRGPVTGRHAHHLVVDDPTKPVDASAAKASSLQLEGARDWWTKTMSSRAVNLATVTRTIIMQRLHARDLAGEMEKTGDYEVLRLPMRFESGRKCVTSVGQDPRTQEGKLLFPERFPEVAVKKLEKDLAADAAAQLQQRPTSLAGQIFKRNDVMRFWSHGAGVEFVAPAGYAGQSTTDVRYKCMQLPKHGVIYQSWDMTFKDTEGTDMVGAGVWLVSGPFRFLVDSINERLDFSDTKRRMLEMRKKWPQTQACYIEDKANGPAIWSALRTEMSGLVLVTPKGGKVARANAVVDVFRGGYVYYQHPEEDSQRYPDHPDKSRTEVNQTQLLEFPRSDYDDLVDQTTQFLAEMLEHSNRLSEAMNNVRT